MQYTLPYFIAQRYTRSKRGNRFVSFIAVLSVLGIALGITVLLTVLSVMNGFQKEIRARMLSLTPQVVLSSTKPLSVAQWPAAWARLSKDLEQYPATPVVEGEVMFLAHDHMIGGMIRGLDPATIEKVLPLKPHLVAGQVADLHPQRYGVILGLSLAQQLGVQPGESITLILPEVHVGLMGVLPRVKRLTVQGLFSVDYLYDSRLALMHIEDAAQLIHHRSQIDGIQLALPDPFKAPQQAAFWRAQLPAGWTVSDWTERNQSYFSAVQMEKTMMSVLLTLLIAIAAFNLVSMLVMTVTDKEGDIAILRAMGASRSMILRIFVAQGLIIGVTGIILGLIGGYLLSHHVTALVAGIEQLLHRKLLSSDLYFINFLPSDFHWKDAIWVVFMAFGMSLGAALYPAWRASRIWPAEALRYE